MANTNAHWCTQCEFTLTNLLQLMGQQGQKPSVLAQIIGTVKPHTAKSELLARFQCTCPPAMYLQPKLRIMKPLYPACQKQSYNLRLQITKEDNLTLKFSGESVETFCRNLPENDTVI